MAALISRFNKVPQDLQVHSRSCNVSSLLMLPQFEQVLLLGSNVPISKIFTPYHSALYFRKYTKIPHPASLIDCASLWFLSMWLICKFSIAILSWFLISSLETLCRKSLRWFATFSCNIANLCFVRFPLCFENLRCTYFNLLCALRRNFGLSNSLPLEVTIKDLIPKSIPTVVFSLTGLGFLLASPVSQSIDTKYLPAGVLLMVACLISPFVKRCKTISIPSLNFGIINLFSFKRMFCGILKLPPFDFFLNLGNSPCPLKNRVKALSKFLIGCCNDWLLISFSQTHSFFKSGNCLMRAKQSRLTRLPAYADCLVSNARLYMNLALPICLFISITCSLVGKILYRNAFSTIQRYINLQIQNNFFKFVSVTECHLQPIHHKG